MVIKLPIVRAECCCFVLSATRFTSSKKKAFYLLQLPHICIRSEDSCNTTDVFFSWCRYGPCWKQHHRLLLILSFLLFPISSSISTSSAAGRNVKIFHCNYSAEIYNTPAPWFASLVKRSPGLHWDWNISPTAHPSESYLFSKEVIPQNNNIEDVLIHHPWQYLLYLLLCFRKQESSL